MSRQTLVTGLVILSIFLAGALSGAAVARMLSGPEAAVAERGPEEGGAEGGERGRRGGPDRPEDRRPSPYAFADFLEGELDLSPAQRAEVEAILERREEEARQIFRESRERFREHLEGTVQEVENALPSEQAAEFRRLMEEMERRFRRDRSSDDDGEVPGPGSR